MDRLFKLWASITPRTRQIAVIMAGVTLITLIIAAAMTGDLGILIKAVFGADK